MASRRTSLTLYRALLRAATAVHKRDKRGLIFTAARDDSSGNLESYQLSTADAVKLNSYGLSEISQLNQLKTNLDDDESASLANPFIHGSDITKLIQSSFRNYMQADITAPDADTDIDADADINRKLDLGFKCLSTLYLLTKQSARSSSHTTTKGDNIKVRIIITTFFQAQLPSTAEYNYHYRVQVENIGESGVQLCGKDQSELRKSLTAIMCIATSYVPQPRTIEFSLQVNNCMCCIV